MTNHQDSSKMKNIKTIFVAILLVLALQVNAQDQDLKRANRYFDRAYYSEAIPLYETVVEDNRSIEVVRNLADSYYYTNNFNEAQKWLRYLLKTYDNGVEDSYRFKYIQTLKAAGDYEEARLVENDVYSRANNTGGIEQLSKYRNELDNVSAIGNRFEIENLLINTNFSEFGAVRYKNNLVYSGIAKAGVFDKVYKWNNEFYLDLLSVSLDSLDKKDIVAGSFSDELSTALHESNAIFTKDGKTVYFTRNNSKNGKKERNDDKIATVHIFSAEWVGNQWANITSLPFNNDNYSTEHPALSTDEKTLYFASDMPGTLGSFDIFSVNINGGLFDTPQNLGPAINTLQKEQFPFIADDGKLYFASNGHYGYGSLDVFVSQIKNGVFSKPENVGLPVNSGHDDFALYINPATKEGWFASNRPGGKGGDDIYGLKETKPLIIEDCRQTIAGTVTDIDTNLPLSNALVTLQLEGETTVTTFETTADGAFSFAVNCKKEYTVKASKTAYTKASKCIKTSDQRYKEMNASLALKSEETIRKEEALALAQKKADLEKQQKQQKIDLENQQKQQKKDNELAAKLEKERAVQRKKEKVVQLLAAEKDVVKDKERLLIKTEPIYFDYNLWYIRKESKPVLNRVIEIMKKYPDMVVEIGSHTDARGNNRYNLDLSSKRAASTRTYFIEQGIPAKRILSKGYGETVQMVNCVPEDSCNEEQHELNRRSEFVIEHL